MPAQHSHDERDWSSPSAESDAKNLPGDPVDDDVRAQPGRADQLPMDRVAAPESELERVVVGRLADEILCSRAPAAQTAGAAALALA